jgi:hypothetical protein
MKQIHRFNLYDMDEPRSSQTIRRIAETSNADYTLIHTAPEGVEWKPFAAERMVRIAGDTSAGITYADYYDRKEDGLHPHPLIDYRRGSLRDGFDFGPLMLFRTRALREAAAEMTGDYRFAGLYDLRLKVSRRYPVIHIPECLYTKTEQAPHPAAETTFDYVNPDNRAAQIEMEQACTDHLKQTGAYLPPRNKRIDFGRETFGAEASVIIPVRNRIRTIADALRSALGQETAFPFNLIVIDNHSDDGTTDEIRRFAGDKRLIHILPEQRGLGIGGCWNTGVHHPGCGKFAVQLDSDDVYSSPHSLQKTVDAFYAQHCGMVVGTYRITDFRMQEIPPGIIAHREWTPENGHNNALRINGFGAPRAFYTPLLRSINFPDVSYGEDYAAALRICREYAIGRIYDVLYLCRRWEDNSDASPTLARMNAYDAYKDLVRTWELDARIKLNKTV